MITLSNCTTEYLQTYCKAVMMARDYHEEIDEDYNLTFIVEDISGIFKIHYAWSCGFVPSRFIEPWKQDGFDVEKSNWFIVLKSDSFRKLTKEIMDAIEEVTKEPFNPVMEREEA